ncbi:MAG: hypothetical protein K2G40_08810 [Muribaculaceae bacterium]|nr:hypothetical protein [Muribaculaceae bacterium]
MQDSIYDIYEQFKKDVHNRLPDMYYDEEDIVMVYDIAGDNGDTYIQLKALQLGYKLFPESEDLLLRIGFSLLSRTDIKPLQDFLNDNTDRKGFIWDILRYRAVFYADEDSIDLDSLLGDNSFTDEEELIQFMNLIEDTDEIDWLRKNYSRIIDASKYKDTAYNELARVFDGRDSELAIKMLEGLTGEDPFNADGWLKLAELYEGSDRNDDARMALDYAKALRSDHLYTDYLDACILLQGDPSSKRASELLEHVIKENPSMTTAKYQLADAYVAQDRKDLAILLWEEELRRHPRDRFAMQQLLELGAADFESVIRAFFEDNKSDNFDPEFFLGEYVEHLLKEERGQDAITVMRVFDETRGLYDLAHQFVKVLYNEGELEELCEFMEKERPEGCPELRMDPISLVMYAAALLRLQRYDAASDTANDYLLKANSFCTNTEMKVQFAGMKIVLHYIIAQASVGNYSKERDPLFEAME